MMRVFVLLPMVAVNGFGLIALAQGQTVASTMSVDMTTLLGQAVILITTILGFLYSIYRENRNRRWDKEDRELARNALVETVKEQRVEVVQKVAEVVKEVEQKVAAVGDTLVAKADQQHIEVSAAIAENTEKTDQAIKVSQEANHLSRKIAELARAYDKVQGRTTALEDRDDAPATAAAASSAASATLVKDLVGEQKEVVADQKVVLGEQKVVLDDQKIVLEKQLKKAK